MPTRRLNDDEVEHDLVIYCGVDGMNAPLWHPLISNAHGGRTSSMHMHRIKNGYYDRREGNYLMAEKSPGWYADHFVEIYHTRGPIIMWCKTDIELIHATVAKIRKTHGLNCRAYILNDKIGCGSDGRCYVNGNPTFDRRLGVLY